MKVWASLSPRDPTISIAFLLEKIVSITKASSPLGMSSLIRRCNARSPESRTSCSSEGFPISPGGGGTGKLLPPMESLLPELVSTRGATSSTRPGFPSEDELSAGAGRLDLLGRLPCSDDTSVVYVEQVVSGGYGAKMTKQSHTAAAANAEGSTLRDLCTRCLIPQIPRTPPCLRPPWGSSEGMEIVRWKSHASRALSLSNISARHAARHSVVDPG